MPGRRSPPSRSGWLLFLPQVPTDQPTLRMRVWRRLQGLGAVGLKSGAQLLPDLPGCAEALHWLAGELEEAGCEATIARCEWVHGMDDASLRSQFNRQRDAEYDELVAQLQAAGEASNPARVAQFERQFGRIRDRDYFGADRAAAARELLAASQARAAGEPPASRRGERPSRGSVWVTRRGVKVDRIASAWLIRRFIDDRARFRFVAGQRARPGKGEVGFDMLGVAFGHHDGLCTFEVLLATLDVVDPALCRLGEMIHELDLKDERYDHPETAGLGMMIRGIVESTDDDQKRIERGADMLDPFLAGLRRSN